MTQVLGPGALGRPRGIGWRGRWEWGLGWGIHVAPWLIHVNVWQNPLKCCEVISLQLIKKKKRKSHALISLKLSALLKTRVFRWWMTEALTSLWHLTESISQAYFDLLIISITKWSESFSVMFDSLRPHGLYSPWNSPGQNTGMGSLSLLQEIFPTQGSNPGLCISGRFFTSWATREAHQ